ncbi:MAG: hypothetical protein QXX38_00855 [Candidatus Aenigmatarchaeota archaeon]
MSTLEEDRDVFIKTFEFFLKDSKTTETIDNFIKTAALIAAKVKNSKISFCVAEETLHSTLSKYIHVAKKKGEDISTIYKLIALNGLIGEFFYRAFNREMYIV